MMEVKQKELRNMVGEPFVEDITHATQEDYDRIMQTERWLDMIAYSCGVYGRNGVLYRGHETGKLYVITSRTTALFIF